MRSRTTELSRSARPRPLLLGLAVLAGFAYAWNATGNLEIYYAAAVRSMSMSWHDFLFGAFDPAGTITLDKLPGAFWVQALSVLFGVHAWALVLPQVVEGVASVLVLHRLVRRLAGTVAAISAALVFVVSPANVALNRGNVPDTLMILLVLLAADAAVRSIITGRLRSLIWAGVLIGFAFQAKMLEARVASHCAPVPAAGDSQFAVYLCGSRGVL
ncbi:MAG TPA: glycosyltransferase family 39 protein [Solirubrobacteraceae bacterium]|nr:glycosyltransferase family 39 protein [Solirubrobacteraceae bacterium]